METNKVSLAKQINTLFQEGAALYNTEFEKKELSKKEAQLKESKVEPIQHSYQTWYTKALPVVKQILPDRYQEFIDQYRASEKRKEINSLTYTISDYMIDLQITRGYLEEVVNARSAFLGKFQVQLMILRSCLERLDSTLSDIQGTLQAELFDNELSAAEELRKKGHLRAAGALAGVTLERHFSAIAQKRGITISKKDPAISDFNDTFKKEGIYDVPEWRFIQRLGDLRNLSVHFKEREPTSDEINELITGTQKVVKTIF